MNQAITLPARMTVASAREGYRARSCLSARERNECALLPDHARRDFRVGRLAAKRALAGLLPDARLHEVEIVSVAHRAPAARWRGVQLVGSLSVAHCDGRAIAAAAGPGLRVGVDLERAGAVPPAHTRYFLTERERESVTADSSVLWAFKEAVWKMLQLGGECRFHALELEVAEDRLNRVMFDGTYVPAHGYVSFHEPGYVSAVVHLAGATA